MIACRLQIIIIIQIDEATTVELDHHRVEITMELRQYEIRVGIRRGGVNAQRRAVVTSHHAILAKGIRSGSAVISVSLTLNEPLIAVRRCLIGDTDIEASGLEVERIGSLTG